MFKRGSRLLINTFTFYLPRLTKASALCLGSLSITTNAEAFIRETASKHSQHHLQTPTLGNSLSDLYYRCAPSVVHLRLEIRTDAYLSSEKSDRRLLVSNGSGFVIRSDGLILTNAHVVHDLSIHSQLKITYHDGTVVPGEVVCIDALSDLALVRPVAQSVEHPVTQPVEHPVKIPVELPASSHSTDPNHPSLTSHPRYPPLPLSSDPLRIGQPVFTIGSPFGFLNTLSAGILTGLHRSFPDTTDARLRFLQTDLQLHPGNSGGPIIDERGRVIGIAAQRNEEGSIGFGIEVASIGGLLKQMLERGKVRRAWLGFRGVSLNHEILAQIDSLLHYQHLQQIRHGILILKAYPSSPAADAHLRPGDVVVAVQGKAVGDVAELLGVVDGVEVGQRVEMDVKRILLSGDSGRIVDLKVYLTPKEYDIFSRDLEGR